MQKYNLKDALIAEVRNRYRYLSPQEIESQWKAAWAEIDRELDGDDADAFPTQQAA